MIDQHGWSPRQWDALSEEEKAIVIASLEFHSEERQKARKKAQKVK